MRHLRLLLAVAATLGAAAPAAAATHRLPAYAVGGLFFAEPRTVDGRGLHLLTDTGGGLYLTDRAVRRLGLSEVRGTGDGGKPARLTCLPAFAAAADIPAPLTPGGRLNVMAAGQDGVRVDRDGILGQAWFRDRVWTFDYPGGQLFWHDGGTRPPPAPGHSVPLGFPVDSRGVRTTSFPRIQAEVDGATVDLLFDTGASVVLTARALSAVGDHGPRTRATSFIVKSRFEAWRAAHPGWRVIPGADAFSGGEPMIEVPRIRIAGYEVGPVWFTRRDDDNFHVWMSRWTDRRIDGALGGSAFRYFRVTADYPRATASFAR